MREKSVFELIVEGKVPCNKVLEDNDFLAFEDINPRAPIHILVIPKKHFRDFQEFEPELMAKMTSFIQKLAVLLGLDKSGYRLVSNCGKNSGQEVFHLHFHILSGFEKTNKTSTLF
ncbi:histidine triad nucleotide-binding protein [Campylobacter upsaliensis]|uniref:Histidine triad nucleotide-binding protein n=1 Tax=Campylobacter upsaliensis TaxID=28080 RepID=A0A5L4UQQ0_CAMUP|nr:histidine triad nucleotide-binding protein [Campylobacter upsaliensis]EAH5217651.1 histidine triad nucleotide-binding protein [Campylobacter upsaliensis]EAH7984659.1 histidine triad nucleotide-binding protein [Campylobacter upsaliensis]EAI0016599.1 histidine triad nucleotide-binding protein [Campylobacter upsaliensis]EAI2137533.1 histidine triad nucleotide-binding protein [Campylobacter upsaliensis]EAI4617076.1 histidine triad nucleotide-binding protein [Campylobacter upsaliensis]